MRKKKKQYHGISFKVLSTKYIERTGRKEYEVLFPNHTTYRAILQRSKSKYLATMLSSYRATLLRRIGSQEKNVKFFIGYSSKNHLIETICKEIKRRMDDSSTTDGAGVDRAGSGTPFFHPTPSA